MTVDAKYAALGRAQARYLAKTQDADIHIFEENGGAEDISGREGRIFYHKNRLARVMSAGLPTNEKWPAIVYARLFVPHIISDYDRLLYLDADTAVLRDVCGASTLDMNGRTIGAVHEADLWTERSPVKSLPNKRAWLNSLGISGDRYFNSGVLLFDVRAYNRFDIGTELVNFYNGYRHAANMWDQDFLNHRFQDDWYEMSPRWNFQALMLQSGFSRILEPIVVHFTDVRKPWHDGYYYGESRYRFFYEAIAKAAGEDFNRFPSYVFPDKILRLKYRMRYILYKLGMPLRAPHRKLEKIITARVNFEKHIILSLENGFFDIDIDFRERRKHLEDRIEFNGNEAVYV